MEMFPRATYELENSVFNSKLYFKILPRASVVDCSDTTYMEFILLVLNGIAAKANKVGAEQIDLVADFYHPLSIKGSTRSDRGTGSRIRFVMDDVLPNDLMSSLTNSDFKTDLYIACADAEILSAWDWKKDYCVTKGRYVVERTDNIITERLMCLQADSVSLEEADNRIVTHIRHTILHRGRSSFVVRTTDSDVVVILAAFMTQFLWDSPQAKLWVDFGTSHKRIISINHIFDYIGEPISLALPFFHALSGCDSTSSFYKKSKVILFQCWMSFTKFEDLTTAFQKLSWLPTDDTVKNNLLVIEQYICYAYAKRIDDLDDLRFQTFKSASNNSFRELPPSKAALALHVKRSAYQSGWVWGNSISQEITPSIEDCGWTINNEQLIVRWANELDQSTLTKLTKVCKCRSDTGSDNKCSSCSCGKMNLSCLEQCKCGRVCQAK